IWPEWPAGRGAAKQRVAQCLLAFWLSRRGGWLSLPEGRKTQVRRRPNVGAACVFAKPGDPNRRGLHTDLGRHGGGQRPAAGVFLLFPLFAHGALPLPKGCCCFLAFASAYAAFPDVGALVVGHWL